MNDYNNLHLHWKKSQKEFNRNLELLKQKLHTEPIHDIRVAAKKLRAFWDLYILLKKDPEPEYGMSKTKFLFDVLGRRRDVEICLALTAAFEKDAKGSCKEWNQYLQSVLKITGAWVNKEIHKYQKKELAQIAFLLKQDNSLGNPDQFSNDLTAIINAQLEETKKHLRQPHLVRKCLKKIYYWISLFPDENTQESLYPSELHDLLDDLGNWQDQTILAIRIKHFRKDYLPKSFEEYRLLKDFENKTNEHKKLLLKTAHSKIRRWMQKVLVPGIKKSEE
ncbi:MAG: CHAD domain-containing protein [Chitinophagaceae bacterium]